MHLTTFRKHGVGPGNWSSIRSAKHDLELDRLLDLADATLTSWKEAHDVFNRWQQMQTRVDSIAFMEMRRLVHKVIREEICNTATSYPCEAITFALLERWIACRREERECEARNQERDLLTDLKGEHGKMQVEVARAKK